MYVLAGLRVHTLHLYLASQNLYNSQVAAVHQKVQQNTERPNVDELRVSSRSTELHFLSTS